MPIKTLKDYQDTAVKSAVEVFTYAKSMLDSAGDDAEGRAVAIHDNGYLLIEAPTGSGKTLMAGWIVEKMSSLDDVVWFWFAPFKGVVDQSTAFLREQFSGLRLRTLAEDRAVSGSRKGDVFVTTWQSVATRAKDRRNVRKSGEQNPSIEELIDSLRAQGMRIGVVIDEAHHSFHGETQAAIFFREVLQPEYTILVTATPDDADLADLKQRMQIDRIHRVTVSRADAVLAGLIKDGIKCVAWMADERTEKLIDFEDTALREGAVLHRALKAELASAKIDLTPLMLVQVASNDKSVERAKEKLIALGFTETQIATHTAAEPDAGLMALANDESREVLIFKMSVALGFDAPRAWTLVSMRSAKDQDFGVQLVGRILRVHRRLQGRKVPETLKYGYVLLANAQAQSGIDMAGQRINQMKTAYAKLSPTTIVVRVGEQDTVQYVGASGQMSMLPDVPAGAIWTPPEETIEPGMQGELFTLSAGKANSTAGSARRPLAFAASAPLAGVYRYALREGVPRQFKTQELSDDVDASEEDCAARFVVNADHALKAVFQSQNVKVQKRTLDIFTQAVQTEFAFTPPSPEQMRVLAQRELLKSGIFHPQELRTALLQRLKAELLEQGIADAGDPAKLEDYLNVLLVAHPELLRKAQKQALARHAVLQDTQPLPTELHDEEPLPPSKHNIYGAVPRDLNGWERDFGSFLDSDVSGTVLWWHRNPPLKPWSVKVLLMNGSGFYPDFVIGIHNRKREQNGLLADPKYAFETSREMPKTLADHPAYGRVLILSKREDKWAIVDFDPSTFRAALGSPFRLADAAHY